MVYIRMKRVQREKTVTESVILTSPGLTTLLGAAFLGQLVLQRKGCRGAVWELLPAAVCVFALLRALLLGAPLEELALVLCGFFVLSLTGRNRA